MLRRVTPCLTSLSGNRIVGIRREDKNVWERRTPLTPGQVGEMLQRKQVDQVIVQPSTIRCFRDSEYAEAGATIQEDLTPAGTILAVKEVPPQLLHPNRTYMFFSHTIKAQAYNMPLLDTIVERNIRLMDYERILGPDGRVVKFGPYAGFAGMIDTLNALGLALLTRGYATPFLNVSLAREYRSLQTAREDLRIAGDIIRQHGLPEAVAPLVFAVTGSGSVSMAAQEILHLLPCKYVEVEDLPKLYKASRKDRHHVYVCVVRSKDMVAPIQEGKAFNQREYYADPSKYKPVFHERVAPYVQVLITGHYWEPRFPRLLTIDQARELKTADRFPLLCLGDITCDIGGSLEFFVKATTIQNPLYAYDIEKAKVIDMQDFTGKGVVILGVDHLPAEFPREASTDFGKGLAPLVPLVAASSADVPLDKQLESLGGSLFGSMVTNSKRLTPNFEYIAKMRAEKEASVEHKRRVLVFGAGMTASPAVATLLKDPRNSVTVVDGSQTNLDVLAANFHAAPDLAGDEKNMLRTAKADVSKVDDYIEKLIKRSDVIVSMLPAPMHATIAKCAIGYKVPMVTASYVSPAMEKLRPEAEAAGTAIINEMGLDPGIDLMGSAELIERIRAQGGKVTKYVSLCGALPQPENSNCPMGYKFSWSPRGVLVAASRPSRLRLNNEWLDVPGDDLFYYSQRIRNFAGLDLHWTPNGNVEKYIEDFRLEDAATVVRGTIRYSGFAPNVRAMKLLGLLDADKVVAELRTGAKNKAWSWPDVLRHALGAGRGDVRPAVQQAVTEGLQREWARVWSTDSFTKLRLSNLVDDSAYTRRSLEEETALIMATFESLGLFNESHTAPKTPSGTVLDSLCETLVHRLTYNANERDAVIMLHRITAEFPKEGERRTYVSSLMKRGDSDRDTATAITVGVPAGLSAQLLLDGGLKGAKGLLSPTDSRIFTPVLRELERAGVAMTESVEVSKL